MSWFPVSGIIEEIRNALAVIVEPWLNIFRRFIPPLGMIDISPIVALIVWQLLINFVANLVVGVRF
jgi:YggT family protein